MFKLIILHFLLLFINVSLQYNVSVHGPGLNPERIIMPARYFFINVTSLDHEKSFEGNIKDQIAVEITGTTYEHSSCRIWTNKLYRNDNTFIVRYKLYESCYNLSIRIYYKSKEIKDSPMTFKGPVYPDQCNCPQQNFQQWFSKYGCPESYKLISEQLQLFPEVDMHKMVQRIILKYHKPETTSFCHYVVKENNVFRNCYGKHIGFNMFTDNILLFLTRKVYVPDMELVINLGDWPLVKKTDEVLPIFSWCGSKDTIDIVMPTYDLTEATIENMGRVTLDTLSVQGSVIPWSERKASAIWRGRDSRLERLKLVDIARENPDLFNVSLTNFFFFRDKEAQYGPKQPHISFFNFFDHKYQINIDGTVAAYRMPYLLAGGGMILKQDSPYFEHFYKQLQPWVHYVPVANDLSDLVKQVKWAREHESEAHQISKNAQHFAVENLLPQHVVCYHAVLFWVSSIPFIFTLILVYKLLVTKNFYQLDKI